MQFSNLSPTALSTSALRRRAVERKRIRWATGWLVISITIAISLRLMFAFLSTGHGYDIGVMQVWTQAMVEQPLSSFYALDLDVPQDHLPGDLLIFAALGKVVTAVAPDVANSSFPHTRIIKAVAAVADLAIGGMIYLLARQFVTHRNALVAMSTFLFSPGVLYVSSIWGQWDAVSAAFTVGAILLGARRGWSSSLAWPVLAYACLIKPQYVLIAPIMLIFFWKRDGVSELARSFAGIIAGVGLVQAVSWLFDLGLPGVSARWSLIERLQASVDAYTSVSLGAHNIWILPIGRGAPFSDQDLFFGVLTFQALGVTLFLLAAIVIIWCVARFANPYAALVWGSTAMMFAMFITMTRMHERYAFPVLPLIVIAAVFIPRLRIAALLVHVAYLLNVHVAYTNGSSGPGILQNDAFYRVNGVFFIALFVYVLWIGVRESWAVETSAQTGG